MRWGLVPSFTKSRRDVDHFRMFNARSETIAQLPSFRRLLDRRRCVVLLSGFFEWRSESTVDKRKQPYYVFGEEAEDGPMRMAGLWDKWIDPETGEELMTFTICTRQARGGFATIHSRVPCLLDEAAADAWLARETPIEAALALLRESTTDASLRWHRVTKRVTDMSFQDPRASKALDEGKRARGKLTAFFSAVPQRRAAKKPAKQSQSDPTAAPTAPRTRPRNNSEAEEEAGSAEGAQADAEGPPPQKAHRPARPSK